MKDSSPPKLSAPVSRLYISALLAVLFLTPVFGGGGSESTSASTSTPDPAASAPLRIVATTTQASDLARTLTAGTDNVQVDALMGAGVDPHLYQPTERDVEVLSQADLVIYNGLHLEGQFDRVFRALAERGVPIFALSQPVEQAGFAIMTPEGSDPHVWFDPRNWQLVSQALADLIAGLSPANADLVAARAASYDQQLDDLYQWARSAMGLVEPEQRLLVTSHDAFQYFGAAFGWNVASIQGLSTEDEAGIGDISGTVQTVVEARIPALFVESSIPPDTIRAVQEAVGAAGWEVQVGVRELYGDAMGAPGTFGGTYAGMIGTNVMTILQTFRCAGTQLEIPPWPATLETPIPQEISNVVCD